MSLKKSKELYREDLEHYLPAFKRYPLALARGEGVWVWDVDGNKYLDVLAGIAVNNLGHCHPEVVREIQEQAETLLHISNFYVSEPQVKLSKVLTEQSGLDRVFFTNSGAESVEGAFKIARKYAHEHGRGGEIIAMKNSFHGRTLATIATGKKKYQEGFDPIPGGFQQVSFNDIDAVREQISEETAAVIVEPIQGEGGIHVAETEYLEELRTLCDEENVVLIFDEIQCGMGRTGYLFAKDFYGVQPDIITLAKGLGAGVPIGAILSNEKVSSVISSGDHGTTFGGNPLVCAAALKSVELLSRPEFLEDVRHKGEWLHGKLEDLREKHDSIREVRGRGLMLGVVFDRKAKPLVEELFERDHILTNATADNVLRLVPPLIIKKEELDILLDALDRAITKLHENA